jgi:hypothetical protein
MVPTKASVSVCTKACPGGGRLAAGNRKIAMWVYVKLPEVGMLISNSTGSRRLIISDVNVISYVSPSKTSVYKFCFSV